MTKEQIEKYRAEFDKKADKYYQEYQETGIAGKEKTYHRYEDLENICGLALKEKKDEDDDKMRRIRNIKKRCEDLRELDKMGRMKYTTAEVIRIIEGMQW